MDVTIEMTFIVAAATNVLVNAAVWLDVNAANPSGNTLAALEGTDNQLM